MKPHSSTWAPDRASPVVRLSWHFCLLIHYTAVKTSSVLDLNSRLWRFMLPFKIWESSGCDPADSMSLICFFIQTSEVNKTPWPTLTQKELAFDVIYTEELQTGRNLGESSAATNPQRRSNTCEENYVHTWWYWTVKSKWYITFIYLLREGQLRGISNV